MKKFNLTREDRQQIAIFEKIVAKPDYKIIDLKNWAKGVTNPGVCKPSNIRPRAKQPDRLDIRYLSMVLKVPYTLARNQAIATQPEKATKKAGRKPSIDIEAVAQRVVELLNSQTKTV